MATVQEALEARKRKKETETKSNYEASQNKVSTALEAYKRRKQSNSKSAVSDIYNRINSEIETIKKVSTPTWGEGTLRSTLDSTRESTVKIENLRRELESYKSYIDEGTYNSLAKTISELSKGYDSLLSSAEVMDQFDSEDSYKAWYEEYKKEQGEKDAVLGAKDFGQFSNAGVNVRNPNWDDAQAPVNIAGWKPFGDGEKIGNMVTFAEANKQAAINASAQGLRAGGGSGQYTELVNLINSYMKDDEKAIYNYYIGKGETDKANAYLEKLTDTLRQRQAGKMVSQADNNILETVFALAAGVQQGLTGFANLGHMITGTEGEPISSLQYAHSEMSSNNKGIWKVTNDLVNTTGNMLPSIGIGIVTGGTGGAIALGASASGNAYAEMRRLGYDEGQSRGYALAVGASEAVLSKFLGGISKLGGGSNGIFQTIAGKVLPKINKAWARVAIEVGGNMLDEGLEEAIQEVLDPIFKMMATGEDFEGIDLENVLYSGLLGALSGGLLEGIPTVYGTAQDSNKAKNIYGNNIQDLLIESAEINGENATVDYMIDKYGKKGTLSGYDINRLVGINQDARITQDKAKMKTAAEETLIKYGEKGDVSKIAEVIAKTRSGEKLTKAEQDILVNSTYGRRVSTEMNPDMMKTGEYNSAWAENIGTELINEEAYNKGEPVLATNTPQKTVIATPDDDDSLKENATEAKIEASDKVTIEMDGKEVEVQPQKITSLDGERMTIELSDGAVVGMDEVNFGESGIGLVYQAAQDMASRVGGFNVDTANVFVRGYSAELGLSAAEYVHGFQDAYRFGAKGFPVSELETGTYTSKLTDEQRTRAYNLGKVFGNEEVAKKQEKIASIVSKKAENISNKASKVKKGRVHFDGSTVGKSLTERQRASLKGLGVVAEAMGIDIYIFESATNAKGEHIGENGSYDPVTKTLRIDLHAGIKGDSLMLYTASHELTHHIREVAPAKFKVFADALLEEYSKYGHSVEELIQDKMRVLKENGRLEGKTEEQAYDLAYEEVVADSAETMLVDSNAIEALSKKIQAKDKGLWETIKDFIAKLVARIKAAYEGLNPDSTEANYVRDMVTATERLQKLWVDALLDASEVTLGESGIIVDSKTDSASLMSVRDVLSHEDRQKVSKALASRFGVTQSEAMDWLKAETSLASLILNPKYSQYLDYTADANEEAIKSNSDYPQGTVDFSNICKKRRDFTEVMNRVLRNFPNHVFAATDLAKIRTIMEEEGMEVACAICYVEDRRQLDSVVAQDFIDSLALYREGSKTRPDGKPFNANQIKAMKLIDGDSYTPSIYELISLEGRNSLKAKNPAMEEAWVKFNNARGMQSVRLLLNDAEYKRQILKYSESVVKRKNDLGGLRIYSFSDAEMFHLIDIIQVITDSATVGLSLQGYTKVNEYARAVKDTGEKLNRSLIPKGDLGYHMENGKVVLDFDTVEGIDINHPDFFDNIDNPNIGNIVIGINATQIKAAMTSKFIDQIIPFHTGQSNEVLGEKGIAAWDNYKDFQSERDAKTKKKSAHQINIYTEVINAAEAEGHPITNKVEFVNKFLEVCRENNLIPRFSDFLNVDENGNYVYTEGYHKFLVDFKTFDQNTGEYLPQMPVKPIFDNEYITGLLQDYVKSQKVKDAELTKAMPKVLDRITNEIVNPSVKYSDRDSHGNTLSKAQQKFFKDSKARDEEGNLLVLFHGTDRNQRITEFLTTEGHRTGLWLTTDHETAVTFAGAGDDTKLLTKENISTEKGGQGVYELYANVKNPFIVDAQAKRYWAIPRPSEMGKGDVVSGEEICIFALENGYDGVILNDVIEGSNRLGTDVIVFSPNQVKYTDNLNPTEGKDIRYSDRNNIGYHAGDLGKSEYLHQQGYSRGTGHFGTGTYFVGDEARISGDNSYGKRPHHAVDFSDYNLYKVRDDNDGYKLHEQLRVIDGGISQEWLDAVENHQFRLVTMVDVYDLAEERFGEDRYSDEAMELAIRELAEKHGIELLSREEYSKQNDIPLDDEDFNFYYLDDYLKPTFKAETEKINSDYEKFRDAHFDLKYRFGFGATKQALEKVLDYQNANADTRFYRDKKDSLATVFMKALGYEGIDVRGTRLDNVEYGSVIYDLKKDTVLYSDRASYAPTFYSHMGNVIDGIRLEKMGAGGVVSYLKGRGVKDEEIKWSGIEVFLEGKKSVTKAELQEFVAGSQLQIVEQMSGEDIDLRYDGSKRAYNLYDSSGKVIDTFTYNEFLGGYVAESDEEIYSNNIELTEALREEYGITSAPKWADYKLDGGTNYRELVFQLPNSTYSNRAMRGHWGQDAEGILVHTRIQDFNVDGKKMLFIEELQSDWHNEGREKGYSSPEYEDAVAVYDKLANEYAKVRQAFNKYVRSGEFRSDPDDVSKKKFDWLRGKVDIAEKRMQDAERDVEALKKKGMGDVADAPFRDNYHEYVLKRLLRMAAEEGYDSIGWTIADTQSKRWSYDYEKAYQIEYDQEMPKFLRKYGKKWGTTVGKSSIGDTEIWSMDISDSMKESVLYEGQVFYSDRVTDKKTLDFLENQEHVTVYRAMQVIDGELYPPMNAYTKDETGKKVLMTPSKIGAWEQAVERPDLIDPKTGKFILDKGKVDGGKKGTPIPAAYNPYFHTSASPLNDQFSSAYKRSNLVVVEGQIPASELTSGYRAEFAKDTVGETKWHSGPVAGKLKGDKARRVFLSRWFKPVRIVSDSEVASIVAQTLEGENIDVPYNVVTPTLRAELEKAGVSIKYSDRRTDGMSNRSLLANTLETAVQNDIEREKLKQYKEKIDLINSEEQKLGELREQIKELSFAKGPRDTKAIKDLQFEANQAANRINTLDKQLLNLESTKALKGVLQREKEMAYKRAEKRGKEALERYRERAAETQRELMTRYQESRKRGVESRNKTAMRHKIKDVVNELNNYLLKGTKDKHVPIELQKPVAEALDAVNMDTVGAEERIAKKRAEMMSAKSPEVVEQLAKEIEHIQEMGGNMEAKLSRLKTAYDSIVNSDDPLVANSHDEVISNSIELVMKEVGDTPLRDMSLYQLEAVYDMYKMVLHSVRNANKAFKAKKSEEISVIANRVMEEVDKLGKKKALQTKVGEVISSFDWNNQKPIYAFERIGSDTFTEVFNNVRSGEDTWAVDMSEAQEFLEGQKKSHNYGSWDFNKRYEFTSSTGKKFSLSLDQIMSLYAYSKRGDQAKDHLKNGGFVFDGLTEVKEKKGKIVEVSYRLKDSTAYNLSEEILADIISKLSPEQKAFADVMQDYLSTVMGEKGNEVSLELYGVKLFKEKNYFPLKSAPQFLERAREQAQGETKIKNKGFTKETTPKARNPIVLTSFMDVWAGHVNEMSMYHAFTLALEDFYRVYNYKTPASETLDSESVISFLENAHGNASVSYIDQLLKDLNGGARVDSTVGIINKLTGLFKKSAVFASASVVIQQPSAIARATAIVDTKYFLGKPSTKKHSETWAEVKKYAPVAVIKEMGYFDTGMGKSSVEWLKGDKTWKDKVDDIASKAPALADEYAWCAIWNAVKRETAHNNPKLKTNSDEFLKLVGERFTEVIVKTQVYDSVLSRSANMRSKDTGMKMATAFMAEPTTSLNMLQNALVQAKRGNKKAAVKAVGGVISSMILNSILVSIVYAGRDDDEDKTYAEKYISTLVEELLDSFNPLTLIPFVKDIVSIAQGYDVERSDMAVITDLINAWNNLDSDNRSVYRKVEDFGGAIATIFGLPVKNVMRDVRGMYNTVSSLINGEKTTGAGIGAAVEEAITGKEKSNGQQLYEAMLNGDSEQIERVKGRFDDQTSIDSAIRKALRENDPRIKEAAEARYNGDIAEYMKIAKSIIAEGNFKQDDIVAAINSEITEIKKKNGEVEASTPSNKVVSLYKIEDYYTALISRDDATAYAVKLDLIETEVANGKDRDDAEASFNSKFASHIRDLYESGDISDYDAKKMLTSYGGKTDEEASSKVQYWDFKKQYPDYDLTEDAVKKYYNEVKSSGISIDVYYDYSKQRAKAKGTDLDGDGKTDSGSVKAEVMQIINSLPISSYQKDALYYLNGWASSTLWEAPWH